MTEREPAALMRDNLKACNCMLLTALDSRFMMDASVDRRVIQSLRSTIIEGATNVQVAWDNLIMRYLGSVDVDGPATLLNGVIEAVDGFCEAIADVCVVEFGDLDCVALEKARDTEFGIKPNPSSNLHAVIAVKMESYRRAVQSHLQGFSSAAGLDELAGVLGLPSLVLVLN